MYGESDVIVLLAVSDESVVYGLVNVRVTALDVDRADLAEGYGLHCGRSVVRCQLVSGRALAASVERREYLPPPAQNNAKCRRRTRKFATGLRNRKLVSTP